MLNPADFPFFASEGFEHTSRKTFRYNCIAWAVGDNKRWWWPLLDLQGKEGYWPKSLPRDCRIGTFSDLFKKRGYKPCKDGSLEVGFSKVAIYAIDNIATHAARQLSDGRWTHKIGANIDVSTTLRAVEGPRYGRVVRYLKIPSPKAPAIEVADEDKP